MFFDVRVFQLLVLARGICGISILTSLLCSHLGSRQLCEDVVGPGSRFKGKHSLDSDEEDEEEDDGDKSSKYNILASDDVEGLSYQFDCLHN